MPQTANDLVDRVKTSCDNQTYLFVFGNESIGWAYNKEILDKRWESRILSKQYFESEEFENLSDEQKNKLLYKGVKAYDAEELDPNTNYITENPSVYEYRVTGGAYGWVKTKYKATHYVTTDKYGITQTYYAYFDENDTYRVKHVMRRMSKVPCTNIYYKNVEGTWIDYSKYINALPTYNIDVASVNWPNVMKISDLSILPKCKYIDAEGYIYDIDAGDGKDMDSGVSFIEVDTNDWSKVHYEPYSINEPDLPFSARHIMNDLKVTIPSNLKRSGFLCWLNGAFVPTIADDLYDNVLYIENAMYMIGSKCVNQTLGAKHTQGNSATVSEDESNNEYRYDVNLRFFGWRGVSVSDFYKPISSEHTTISYNYASIYPIKQVTYPVEINKDAHMIICNGEILDPNDYTIEADGKTVTFKNVESDGYELLNEIVKDINENSVFYENVNPLKMVSRVLTNKTYSLVNFSADDETKKVKLRISSSCCVNFPYKDEVTFPKMNIGDLILTRGLYVPFSWIHQNTIAYPKMTNSYSDGDTDGLKEEDIKRYYFVLEDK